MSGIYEWVENANKRYEPDDQELDCREEIYGLMYSIQHNANDIARNIERRLPPVKCREEGFSCFPSLTRSAHELLLKDVESSVFSLCSDLGDLAKFLPEDNSYKGEDRHSKVTEDMISVINQPDMFGIKTPYLKRSTNPYRQFRLPYGNLIQDKLFAVDPEAKQLIKAHQICVYCISVYPVGTPPKMIHDPDNLALKVPIDVLTRKLKRDDNGLATQVIIGAVISNELDKGSYTVIVEKSSDFLSPEEVAKRLS